MIFFKTENAGCHPFAGNYQVLILSSADACPTGAGNHSYLRDVRIFRSGNICKMPLAIVYKQVTQRRTSIFSGNTPSSNKQIRKPVMIKVVVNRYGGIHPVENISKSTRIYRKIAMPVIFIQTVLHFTAVGL